MRWKLFNCILLASVLVSDANERPKRSLGYIKNLISSTLFGSPTNSVVVAQLIAKNNTHQLFSIPGQNFNLLIQVAAKEKGAGRYTDAKIVSTEMAILGNYLGTKSEGETILAVDMVKNLIKSGVLQGYRDNFLQRLVVETKEKISTPLHIYAQERNPLYIYPGQSNIEAKPKPVPIYPVELPPVFVKPELVVTAPTKYSYKQFGNEADMKYESYNGKDVIVTRTTKEPYVPPYFKYRIKEVATLGSNPYLNVPVAATVPSPVPVNISPIPYQVRPTSAKMSPAVDKPYNLHINIKPILSPQPAPLQKVENIAPMQQGFAILDTKEPITVTNNAQPVKPPCDPVKLQDNVEKNVLKDKKEEQLNDILKRNLANGNVASTYVYKQVNSQNPSLSTVIKVENQPVAKPAVQSHENLSKNYVFVPPKDVNVPPPIALSSQQTVSASMKQSYDHVYTSNTIPYVPNIGHLTIKTRESFKSNPIVVGDDNFALESRQSKIVIDTSLNNIQTKENKLETIRGDIPGAVN